jgi:hypothetical protein
MLNTYPIIITNQNVNDIEESNLRFKKCHLSKNYRFSFKNYTEGTDRYIDHIETRTSITFNDLLKGSLPSSIYKIGYRYNLGEKMDTGDVDTIDGDTYPSNLLTLDLSNYSFLNIKNLREPLDDLSLPIYSIKSIDIDVLPKTLRIIKNLCTLDITKITNNTNDTNNDNPLPSLTEIVLHYDFNDSIDFLKNITSLTHIKLGDRFNIPVDNLPSSLKVLEFGSKFNQPIDRLPSSIIKIYMPENCMFDQPLCNLPTSLQRLELGIYSKHEIVNLPPTLKYLTIHENAIKDLPKDLIYLSIANISMMFIIKDMILLSLRYLFVRSYLMLNSVDVFLKRFPNLIVLKIPCQNYLSKRDESDAKRPKLLNVNFLTFNDELKNMKNHGSIKIVSFDNDIINNINDVSHYQKHMMRGQGLNVLIFHDSFNKDINHIPDTVTYMRFGLYFNSVIKRYPNSLRVLKFGRFYDKEIKNLPPSLRTLKFLDHSVYSHDLRNLNLLICLEVLYLPIRFNKDITFPPNLTVLHLGYEYDKILINLPSTLRELYLSARFNQTIDHLPDNIYKLVLGYDFNQNILGYPKNLTILDISSRHGERYMNNVPSSVKILYLSFSCETKNINLPSSITNVDMFHFSNQRLFRKQYPNVAFDKNYMVFGKNT